jgi:hypothetical protein
MSTGEAIHYIHRKSEKRVYKSFTIWKFQFTEICKDKSEGKTEVK